MDAYTSSDYSTRVCINAVSSFDGGSDQISPVVLIMLVCRVQLCFSKPQDARCENHMLVQKNNDSPGLVSII